MSQRFLARSGWLRTSVAGRSAVLVLAGVICTALLAGGCGSVSISVNGQEVSGAEYRREVDRRLLLVKKKNPKELQGHKGRALAGETGRQVATEMIKAELLEQQAREQGFYRDAATEAKRRLDEERAALGEEGFEKLLGEQYLTEADYMDKLLDKVLVEQMGQRVSSGLSVTPDEVESFYLTHKELYSASAMLRVAHILVDTEGQARMAAEQAGKGDDFAKLAQAISQDVATRNTGGDMGWIEKGTLDPDFERAAFALSPGQVSGVVKASDGYHVIKVLDRRDAYTLPFEQVKDRAAADLLNLRKEEKYSDWLRTVYANAAVLLSGGIGTWDPVLGMVVEGDGQ